MKRVYVLLCLIFVFFTKLILAAEPIRHQQEFVNALEIISSDSLDPENRMWVDSMLHIMQQAPPDTILFKEIHSALVKIDAVQHPFVENLTHIYLRWIVSYLRQDRLSQTVRQNIQRTHILRLIDFAAVLNLFSQREKTITTYYKALELAEKYQDAAMILRSCREIAVYSLNTDEYQRALEYAQRAHAIGLEQNPVDTFEVAYLYSFKGLCLIKLGKFNLAESSLDSAIFLAQQSHDTISLAHAYNYLCSLKRSQGQWEEAYQVAKLALPLFKVLGPRWSADFHFTFFTICVGTGRWQEAERFLPILDKSASEVPLLFVKRNAANARYQVYRQKGRPDKALTSYLEFISLRDSIQDEKNTRALFDQQYQYEYRQKALQDSLAIEQKRAIDQVTYQARIRDRNIVLIALVFLVSLALVFGYIQYRTRQQKQQLAEEVQSANKALIRTQDQLILQEKMASLGQMTAGIAHEIKNPLNFIYNFAEGAGEIFEELKEQFLAYRQTGDQATYEELVDTIDLLQENNRDILINGKRANQVVNSMMDHANDKQGEKRATDLNQLIGHQAHLALAAYQTQGVSLEVKIVTEFASEMPPIDLFPQEFGRVLLNIFRNAFEAIAEKQAQADSTYAPMLQVRSFLEEGQIGLSIKDNGIGIPAARLGQVFQPFFTTKAAGQGNTGLGLSISYDIITKGHQGSIAVTSEEGAFTEFVIRLPMA